LQAYDFLPRFAPYLIDPSGLAPEEVKGGLKAKVAQLTRGGGLDYVACLWSIWQRHRSAGS